MRSPDPIQVLLRLRCERERAAERDLAEILNQLKITRSKLANVSAELEQITAQRLGEVQSSAPNTHHQAVEAYSRAVWQRCAGYIAEIEKLKVIHAHRMAAHVWAQREREVVEKLNKRRASAVAVERRRREQKANEDIFLGSKLAKRDT